MKIRSSWCAGSRPASAVPRGPRSLLPEVEQPAGDDVALDLGGTAVDGRRARVQVLRAPWCVVELQGARQQIPDRVVEPLLGGGEKHLVDGGIWSEPHPITQPVLGDPGPAAQRVQREIGST